MRRVGDRDPLAVPQERHCLNRIAARKSPRVGSAFWRLCEEDARVNGMTHVGYQVEQLKLVRYDEAIFFLFKMAPASVR
jgi:hypothetical protein